MLMKHVFTITAAALLLGLTFSAQAQNQKSKSATQTNDNLPYTAMYSSKFQMGSSKYSRLVLNAWKAYDDNTLDNIANFVADSITATFPDGTVIKGKENFLNGIKAYRSGFSAVKSDVDAWLPVKSLDKGDDLVCIWGRETETKNDGTVQKSDLHEVWAFNKDGKVVYLRQFAAQAPKDAQ